MNSELVQNAIRDPTADKVQDIMSDITPGILSDVMPNILGESSKGAQSEVLAEQTLDQIFTVVETKVLGDGVDFVFDRFGDRIVDLVTGNMYSIFERVAMLMVGS